MKKIVKFIVMLAAIILLFGIGVLSADKYALRTQILRMHVIANSDSKNDQAAKLCVRDSVIKYLEQLLHVVDDVTVARVLISQNIDKLEKIANEKLRELGNDSYATVKLTTEKFDKRKYDTFSLPSGVYDSLRIEIGSGEGKNWWCVVFPALCVPKTFDEFENVAVSSGFDEDFVGALSNERKFSVRFYFLDCIGKIENFLNNS